MSDPRVVYLSGGVGGARLAHGLSRALPPGQLRIVVNTGDDFEHWGLCISPDLDTVMYTLADLADAERGWGLAEESFRALAMVERYGGANWFALGDRDIGTHLMRSEALRRGHSLTEVTAQLCAGLGVAVRVLPMCDAPCPIRIDTASCGELSFQDWLVRERGEPEVRGVGLRRDARATDQVLEALEWAELVVIGPSNPYVSIDPILALAGVRERVRARPVYAVSPILHGAAVKGPLARMIPALAGRAASAAAVADHYGEWLSGFLVEPGDEAEVRGVPVLATGIRIAQRAESRRLAEELLAWFRSRT